MVLVDEYDKPILDALEDRELARANRNYLRGLYSTLKFADAHIRFSFITGVSKFSKVSLFSGLNNLRDITLDPRYSGLCGYTEGDLDAVFAPELPGLDRGAIREWYNGYSWLGGERVYNPFDILLLFESREFKAHWLETGTPTFLVDTLFRRRVRSVDFDGMLASDEAAVRVRRGRDRARGAAVPDRLPDDPRAGARRRENALPARIPQPRGARGDSTSGCCGGWVRTGAGRWRTACGCTGCSRRTTWPACATCSTRSSRAFRTSGMRTTTSPTTRGFYASVFYSYFAGLGLDVAVEDSTNRGRLDMAVRFEDRVYVFEFKVVEQAGAGAAMAQLVDRGYADKYRSPGVRVHLVGVEFSSASRNVVAFEHAAA